MLRILRDEQWGLRGNSMLTRIKKPVFDVDPCRPSFVVDSVNHTTSKHRIQAIELGGFTDRSLDSIDLDRLLATIADDAVAIDVAALSDPDRVAAVLRSRHAVPLNSHDRAWPTNCNRRSPPNAAPY